MIAEKYHVVRMRHTVYQNVINVLQIYLFLSSMMLTFITMDIAGKR